MVELSESANVEHIKKFNPTSASVPFLLSLDDICLGSRDASAQLLKQASTVINHLITVIKGVNMSAHNTESEREGRNLSSSKASNHGEPYPVLTYELQPHYQKCKTIEFCADVWYKFPGGEGEYSAQQFMLPQGILQGDLNTLLARQSRLLVAIKHMAHGFGSLAKAAELDPRLRQGIEQLIQDREFRQQFRQQVDEQDDGWDAATDLARLADKYFPLNEED